MTQRPRDEWDALSELDMGWAHYLATYNEREEHYHQWCIENRLDPEATETAVRYEREWDSPW